MSRITWLVGPPGAGKSTHSRQQQGTARIVELTSMLGPLVDPLRLRKGVLSANGRLVDAIRAIEHHPDHAHLPELLVVAGLVPEAALFPLRESEEVVLLLPERSRWERQLRARPTDGGSSGQYDDFEYAARWYHRFENWLAADLPIRRIEVPFDPDLLGRVVQ
jgi:hypothetical protein